MKELSLNEFLLRNHPTELTGEDVLKVLLTDSQDLLLLISSILLSEVLIETEKVPDNISGNLYMGLEKPSQGKLLNFATWMSQNTQTGKHKELKDYLLVDERKKQGWITRLLQLRNAYVHPKSETKEEVLSKALHHISEIPDLSHLGRIVCSPAPTWHDASGETLLYPFVTRENDDLLIFSEFIYPDQLVFHPTNESASTAFNTAWKRIKYLDRTLYRPTNEDLLVKIEKASGSPDYRNDSPKWLSDFFKSNKIGMMIEPGLSDGILGSLKASRSQSLILDISPTANTHPLECMKNDLELLNDPDLTRLSQLASRDHPLIILIRTAEIPSHNFLQAMYMIADVFDSGMNPHLKFFIEREAGKLQEEQDRLWDELPDNMDKIFRKYSRKSSFEPTDYLHK